MCYVCLGQTTATTKGELQQISEIPGTILGTIPNPRPQPEENRRSRSFPQRRLADLRLGGKIQHGEKSRGRPAMGRPR